MKHNKQACYDICVKINKLIDIVHAELKGHDDADTNKGIKMRVEALERFPLPRLSHEFSLTTTIPEQLARGRCSETFRPRAGECFSPSD